MLTQIELEQEMYAFGRSRTERMMSRNEEGGRADTNPYAKAVYRRFVLPLAQAIQDDIQGKKAGRRKAHSALLAPMDPEAVAYLAVRNTLNTLLHGQDAAEAGGVASINARAVCTAVGKSVYHELLLSLFEEASPDLFYTLVNDFGRRMSKAERHRMRVFKMQAKENGVPFPEWGPGGTSQVGAYLVNELEALGLVETRHKAEPSVRVKAVRQTIDIRLSADVLELISSIKGHVVETTPYYLPCVEQPKDWVSVSDGGFHTKAMRRMQPYAVRSHGGWSEFEDHDMSTVLGALNDLQSVPWQINGRMLDAIRTVAKHFDMEEILSQAEFPAPARPGWLESGMKQDVMSPAQQEEFINWKRQKAEWFTQMKLRGTKYGRFYTATTVAEKFRAFPSIYFVYFADFRGRFYAQTTGVSPQGSDMQKALLRFALGKPLATRAAERWFCIHGANKYGFDKASLDDRVQWVADRRELILSFADDPVAHDGWTEADCPLQFLAWCQEYADWQRDPEGFLSHIPVGKDGSCNGLQNFSAMLRDEIGGEATNLLPSPLPNDIYQQVADVTLRLLQEAGSPDVPEPDGTEETEKVRAQRIAENRFRELWLGHGINRSLVKRSVMTLPYGSTRFSCADFIVSDYLKQGKAKEFEKDDYRKAAQYLSHFVWEAIGGVVVKAREAMDWLQQSARKIIKDGNEVIRWIAPSGFPVAQWYQEQDNHRIRTRLCGNAFLRLSVDNDTPDANRHRNGIAPNFVHTHDAAHMTLTTRAASAKGMHLAMVHDDFGTHAADAEDLFYIIRKEFVDMYSNHDPLAAFASTYDLPPPPAKGTLDITEVMNSTYFFS